MRGRRRDGRWIGAALALSLLISGSTPASASGASVFAGAGPRFSSGETAAVGSLRATVGLESLLGFSIAIDGFLTSPGTASTFDFAGAEAGLLVDLPVPGPLTPELGLVLGLVRLSPERHGADESLLTINAEIGLRAALGPVKLRAAWMKPLWSGDAGLAERAITSQLMFSLGVGI